MKNNNTKYIVNNFFNKKKTDNSKFKEILIKNYKRKSRYYGGIL